jgi:NADH-quinone oxidoreductase subunit E
MSKIHIRFYLTKANGIRRLCGTPPGGAIEEVVQVSAETTEIQDLAKRLDPIIERFRGNPGATIPLLAEVQKEVGYVAEAAVDYISDKLKIPAAEMFGVATFYSMFRFQPQGEYVIRLCRGTACHVQGSARIGEQLKRTLQVEDGGTTDDRLFSLQFVACLGCCSLAPVMMVNDQVFGRLTPEKADVIVADFRKLSSGKGGNGEKAQQDDGRQAQ